MVGSLESIYNVFVYKNFKELTETLQLNERIFILTFNRLKYVK